MSDDDHAALFRRILELAAERDQTAVAAPRPPSAPPHPIGDLTIAAVVIVVADELLTVDDALALLRVLREEAVALPDGVVVALHEDGVNGRVRFGGRRFRRAECQELADRLEAALADRSG